MVPYRLASFTVVFPSQLMLLPLAVGGLQPTLLSLIASGLSLLLQKSPLMDQLDVKDAPI